MRLIDFLHRWAGGLLGLLLAVLGVSGALLVHKDTWLRSTLPQAADTRSVDDRALAAVLGNIFASKGNGPRSVVLADDNLGVHRLYYGAESRGAYADRKGKIITHWDSNWERPEVLLFDLHHYLLIGKPGKTIIGIAGIAGIGFVLTGIVLWWRTRHTFEWRLWPKRMSRPAIVRHHRDLGVVMAPVLLISFITGVMMTIEPLEKLILMAFSPAAPMEAFSTPPRFRAHEYQGNMDWTRLIAAARKRFPEAELRMVSLPARPGAPMTIRMRQPTEWLPNGRSMLWFDPDGERLLGSRDAQQLPRGLKIANAEYPIHGGKVGGVLWKFLVTTSGLALGLLGTFAVWTFWFRPAGKVRTPQVVRQRAL